VIHQGPADRAGLRAGDVVLTFDGQEIVSSADLPRLASLAGVGRQVQIQVWRGGKTLKFTLKTEKMPE
jgi:serine protease Do